MNVRRFVPGIIALVLIGLTAITVGAQGRGTPKTEFFAVDRPYVVGQEGRFSAHLTHITDRCEAYPVNTNVTLRLVVGGTTIEKTALTERFGVFFFLFTPE
jgi:hypothetical protein